MIFPRILVLASFAAAFAFDPIEYIQKDHDKLFFGAGGGMGWGINAAYTERFPDYSKLLLLQAGVGDFPFVFDIRYLMEWASGYGEGLVSGTGASLRGYEILPSARIYLFWKHPHVRSYVLTGMAVHQEEMVSTTASSEDKFQGTEGVRFGLCAGIGFDIAFSEGWFVDFGMNYKYLNSDLFDFREMLSVELLVSVGK